MLGMVIVLAAPQQAWAQADADQQWAVGFVGPEHELPAAVPPEMLDPAGWDYLKPVGNLLFTNMIFWATARFVLDKHYAYINLQTMRDNLKYGFEWDEDEFPTNQLGHPYQGGLYHSGARAVGFSFWGAIPYTFLGSLHWELFMETERPSYNDLVTTTVGGVVLGEVIYRLSSALLDDESEGVERVGREGGALALSPIFGISRLVSGDATRAGESSPTTPLHFRLGAGLNNFRVYDAEEGIRNLGASAHVVYGDYADDSRPFQPFDWFVLDVGLKYSPQGFHAADFDMTGLLARWLFNCGEGNVCAWGPSMHYDYHHTPLFSVGTSAVGALAFGRFELGLWDLKFSASQEVAGIALGGFDSPYAEIVERDYNLGSGVFGRTTLTLAKPDWFRWRAYTSRYYVRTLHGAAGHELAGISGGELEIPIYYGLGLAGGVTVYDRLGAPFDYPEVSNAYVSQQLQLYWRL